MTEPSGLPAAHAILDLVQVWQYGGGALDTAAQELATNGAIQASFDETSQQLDIDVSNLLVGVLGLLDPLLEVTATNWSMTKEQVVEQLRRILDDNLT